MMIELSPTGTALILQEAARGLLDGQPLPSLVDELKRKPARPRFGVIVGGKASELCK